MDTIRQSIFCAQSRASIRLTVWKQSGESQYPGAFPPVLENFRRAFSPGPTDRPGVSEDAIIPVESIKYNLYFLTREDNLTSYNSEGICSIDLELGRLLF